MSDQALEADAPVEPGAPELLAAVRAHRAEFEDAGRRAEELRTVPPDTVATLRDLGLFWLKTRPSWAARRWTRWTSAT